MRLAQWKNIIYKPVAPCADSQELSDQSARLILRHDSIETEIKLAPKGELHSGWVIGVEAIAS